MQFALEPCYLLVGALSYLAFAVLSRMSKRSSKTSPKERDEDAESLEDEKLRNALLSSLYQACEPEPECNEPDSEPDNSQASDDELKQDESKAKEGKSVEKKETTTKKPTTSNFTVPRLLFAASIVALSLLVLVNLSRKTHVFDKVFISEESQLELSSAGIDPQNLANDRYATGKVFQVKLDRQRTQIYRDGDTDYFRSAYYGTIQVGTPPQLFTVVFDTGSGHLVLPSYYCHTEVCAVHKRYRKSASKSARDIDHDGTVVKPGQPRDQITVAFGTGQITGVFVEDVVCLRGDDIVEEEVYEAIAAGKAIPQLPEGGLPAPDSFPTCPRPTPFDRKEEPVCVESPAVLPTDVPLPLDKGCMNMRFIAATKMSEDPFKSFTFDGVLGLGLEGLSQTPYFNFLTVVANSVPEWGGSAVSQPHTFAVFLAKAHEESKITIGGWSRRYLKEEISWNAVEDPEMGHWVIAVKGVRVGNKPLEFCAQGCKAVVDTGTSLLSVPSDAFPEIYDGLKHRSTLNGDCPVSGPQLHFEFENYTITVGPSEYARLERRKPPAVPYLYENSPDYHTEYYNNTRADVWCKPTLMTLDLPEPIGPKLFILGEPVLRKYYTVYDAEHKRVGLGRANHLHTRRTNFHPGDGGEDAVATPPRVGMFDAFRSRKYRV